MPVAAVAGRRDVLDLSCRESHRVKFEGGTFSAHELSLIAARTILNHVIENEDEIYPRLTRLGDRMRSGISRIGEEAGICLRLAGAGSLVFAHPVKDGGLGNKIWRPVCN